jgi:hypothetical protein
MTLLVRSLAIMLRLVHHDFAVVNDERISDAQVNGYVAPKKIKKTKRNPSR